MLTDFESVNLETKKTNASMLNDDEKISYDALRVRKLKLKSHAFKKLHLPAIFN
jgi:hypothetical protein